MIHRPLRAALIAATALLATLGVAAPALAAAETPYFADQVAAGKLPPVDQRLPAEPRLVTFDDDGAQQGKPGGDLATMMSRAKDVRIIFAYSYARLMTYTTDLTLEPDILQSVESDGDQVFTLHLRPGHRWSDGSPFTAEDFRYWWEDVILDPAVPPDGPPPEMLVNGEGPVFEVIDETTVRYSWKAKNPMFLPGLASARPLEIFGPSEYLKKFHVKYAEAAQLKERVKAAGQKTWAHLHNRMDNAYDNDNPDMPTLQPWVNTTAAPAERFVFVRNPYYHRIDPAGNQLPYIDRLLVQIADGKIIPAKAGAGEADLQARYIRFDNYTFLKQAAKRNDYKVDLWKTGYGSHLALFPNLNTTDPVWHEVFRDVRFRRALSIGIDRDEINEVIYYGLARASNNTVLPRSPLYKPEYQNAWTQYDVKRANQLLDEMGLTKRGSENIRLLPDGRPMELIVETSGESTEEVDVLELIADSWRKIGVKLFTKPSQLEVLRNRIYAGQTLMSIGKGVDNGIPTADMAPTEFVPIDQNQYEWPKWGQYFQTGGTSGEKPDMEQPKRLMELMAAWRNASGTAARAEVWHEILAIHADQVFTIGLINGTLQPVVVRNTLRNVPDEGIYNWDPGAHFGIYRPDTFWFAKAGDQTQQANRD
ncbi:peptide ABC transporter substrate-binding protein [Skermanella stibiiresistens SB22]|uniref:Peptide ABC transporter substrate-binding protein n=1 Tax=Skermanella stibiiresistens SB22 TaxID=1385369 RepID=W9H9Z4_9PROT|nr:ABC transporter substrate-binding protein [Skermanella stibiiresistens]EWY40628.1 peptide ABC transporter substrate-binding protein [Skermanella stibiiresistens SB22]